MIEKLLSDEQAEQVVEQSKEDKVVVCFSASWCAPCRIFAPIVEKVAEEQNVVVYKVDIDECTDFSLKHKIRSIPTLAVFQNGKITNAGTGVLKPEEVLSYLK